LPGIAVRRTVSLPLACARQSIVRISRQSLDIDPANPDLCQR
jgi:hypothetical protein